MKLILTLSIGLLAVCAFADSGNASLTKLNSEISPTKAGSAIPISQTTAPQQPSTASWQLIPALVYFAKTGIEYVVNVPLRNFDTKVRDLGVVTLAAFTGVSAKTPALTGGLDVYKGWDWVITPTISFEPALGAAWSTAAGQRTQVGPFVALGVTLRF
jgi:hypothetical protein